MALRALTFFQVLSCLATLLRKQDLEAWGYPVTLQVYHGLLSFTVHSKPKVRKCDKGTATTRPSAAQTWLAEWHWGACPEYWLLISASEAPCI